MRRILLTICYDGTAYCGWQVQPNGITVQETVQNALESVLSIRPNVTGCSRTDSGVHANSFCCHIDLEAQLSDGKLVDALNATLPYDIAVLSAKTVAQDFHARYSCLGKNYMYKIWNSRQRNPFYHNRALHYKYPIDVDLLNGAANEFLGKRDFSAFCSAGSSVVDNVRTVSECSVKRDGELVTVSISADGFLYNMVRIIVGTLLEVNSGKIAKEDIGNIIDSQNRDQAGATAPPHGLYLNEVFY